MKRNTNLKIKQTKYKKPFLKTIYTNLIKTKLGTLVTSSQKFVLLIIIILLSL